MKLLLTISFYCICIFCFAQTAVMKWEKSFGGSAFDGSDFYTAGAVSICYTSDGGSIFAGQTKSDNDDVMGNHGDVDIWVVKLNKQNKIVWQKCLGGSGADYSKAIKQTYDGGYIIIGTTNSKNDGDVSGIHGFLQADAWVVKLDAAGNISWQKCLGSSDTEHGLGIQQTADSGYIVACETSSSDGAVNDGDVLGNFHGFADYWLVKLDKNGSIQWQKLFGGSNYDSPTAIERTFDGGYVLAGVSASNNGDVTGNHGGAYDGWIVKLNAAGTIEWQKCIGGSWWDEARSIKQTADSGYIVACITQSFNGDAAGNHGNSDILLMKLDKHGNISWKKCIGGSAFEDVSDIQIAANGYVMTGLSNSADGDVTGNHGMYDYWTVKTDSTGNILWQISSGGKYEDCPYSLCYNKDDGYLIAGKSNSITGDVTGGNQGNYDIWIVNIKEETVLPVTLLSFSAQKQNNTVLLKWQTTNEINNSYFGIERSADSKAFTSISKINAANTGHVNNYSFTDNLPLQGINYYRLKQVDNDGSFAYSEIESADLTNSSSEFSVLPNPATNTIKIIIPSCNAISTIALYDMSGRRIMREAVAASINSKIFNISRLAPGVYNLMLVQDGKSETIRFIKK